MTVSKIAGILPALVLIGCSEIGEKLVSEADFDGFSAAISEVTAEQCQELCRFVSLDVSITNLSNQSICVPSIYGNENIFGAVTFHNSETSEVITTSESYDPNVFLDRNYNVSMKTLSEMPQYVLAPGDSRLLRVVMERKFDLTANGWTARIRLGAFDCSTVNKSDPVMKVYDLSSQVVFH